MVFTVLITVISCSTTDDNNVDDSSSGDNSTANQIENTAQTGTWRITYFYDSDHEETNSFSGYNFTFNSDGSLIAVNGNTTITGSWSITDSSSSSSDDDHHFNIFFASPNDFEELSDDWEIISTSDTKIKLTDVSGGNGGIDFLTFEKN
ncbi:MAG: hypothetical protein COB12_01995 [Flavobacterium sp.]|nr:MAG: hypothetical protein COB12_01995 [Flavobacterium sp.]